MPVTPRKKGTLQKGDKLYGPNEDLGLDHGYWNVEIVGIDYVVLRHNQGFVSLWEGNPHRLVAARLRPPSVEEEVEVIEWLPK